MACCRCHPLRGCHHVRRDVFAPSFVAGRPPSRGQTRAAAPRPPARWLLCVRGFQLPSVSLNGPIQGHSRASETPAARTQQLRGVLPMRMCPWPASRSPDCSPGLGPGRASRGPTWTKIGGSFVLGTRGLWEGRRECASWACTSSSLTLTFSFYLCVPPS